MSDRDWVSPDDPDPMATLGFERGVKEIRRRARDKEPSWRKRLWMWITGSVG